MQIGSLIRRAALQFGEAPCLVEGARVVSFREFDRLTDKLGNALIGAGFTPGDRIGVLLPTASTVWSPITRSPRPAWCGSA